MTRRAVALWMAALTSPGCDGLPEATASPFATEGMQPARNAAYVLIQLGAVMLGHGKIEYARGAIKRAEVRGMPPHRRQWSFLKTYAWRGELARMSGSEGGVLHALAAMVLA